MAVKWEKEPFRSKLFAAVRDSICLSDAVRKLGLRVTSGNFQTLKRNMKKLGISIEHFDVNKAMTRGLATYVDKLRARPLSAMFRKDSESSGSTVKSKILKQNLIEYRCEICKNPGIHNGKKLSLQLDHKNGIADDHRLPNLRFLCPNCHSQTKTFGNKNSRALEKYRKYPSDERIISVYKRLKSKNAVSLRLGVSYSYVSKVLKRNKVTPIKWKPTRGATILDYEKIYKTAMKTGCTKETAKRFGITPKTVRKIIKSKTG